MDPSVQRTDNFCAQNREVCDEKKVGLYLSDSEAGSPKTLEGERGRWEGEGGGGDPTLCPPSAVDLAGLTAFVLASASFAYEYSRRSSVQTTNGPSIRE